MSDSDEDAAATTEEEPDLEVADQLDNLSLDVEPDANKDYMALAENLCVPVSEEVKKASDYGMPGWIRGSNGGLTCVDKAAMEKQKGVMSHMIRSLGMALLSGKKIMNVSLPVCMFEPRSVLERITDNWCYAPLHLTRAATAADPVERMKWVVTFILSGLHRGCTNAKPFNPILGETFQAHYVDGTHIFMEQVSHHPPISAFQVIGPDNLFMLHGHHEFTANFKPNSLVGRQVGPNTIIFKDGACITYRLPPALVKGTLFGERNYAPFDSMSFHDLKNNVHADVTFNPDEKSALLRMFSSQKTPTDAVRGEIYSLQDDGSKRALSKLNGSWMEHISFDKQPYWEKLTITPFEIVPDENPLPSDCRFREDLIHLKAGDEPQAQRWKEVLEDRQREDRKLRKRYEKIMARLEKANRRGDHSGTATI